MTKLIAIGRSCGDRNCWAWVVSTITTYGTRIRRRGWRRECVWIDYFGEVGDNACILIDGNRKRITWTGSIARPMTKLIAIRWGCGDRNCWAWFIRTCTRNWASIAGRYTTWKTEKFRSRRFDFPSICKFYGFVGIYNATRCYFIFQTIYLGYWLKNNLSYILSW